MIRVYLAPVRDFGTTRRENQRLTADAVLLEQLGETPHREENGRPVVSRGFVSISHSEDTVAVAISEAPVGIDIEEKRERPERLWKRVGAKRGYPDWCRKEAYVKFLGDGFTTHPRSVEVPRGVWTETLESDTLCLAVCAEEEQELTVKREVQPHVWETALLRR